MAIAEAAAPSSAETTALRRTSTCNGSCSVSSPCSTSWPSTSSVSCSLSTGCALIGRSPGSLVLSVMWRSLLSLQCRDDLVEVVGLDQDVACLASLAGADHAAALEDVHQTTRLREADPQLALQH